MVLKVLVKKHAVERYYYLSQVPECSFTNFMDINRFCICTGCKLQAEVRGVKTLLTDTLSGHHTRVFVFFLHGSY